ncbi:Riboflavin kinase [uncultured archaeon]|nr:Riboflavin kinase [uncultured archaeon]
MITEIVFYLLQKGAHKEAKRITTGEIADAIGVSQQTASRKLIELEKDGQLERVMGKVRLTDKAIVEVRKCVSEVLASLEGTGMIFRGKVVRGLGEGSFFVGQKEYVAQFKKKLGFMPFKGTLNLFIDAEDVEKRLTLREEKPIEIPGFSKGKRKFGKIAAYKCMIGGLPGAIVFPDYSQHGLQTLEIISSFNLRKELKLEDGAIVPVEIAAHD